MRLLETNFHIISNISVELFDVEIITNASFKEEFFSS